MQKTTEQVNTLKEKFKTYYPGGHSNRKIFPASMRTIVSRAEGTRFWDMAGNEYLDYACAFGPNILGHQHPEYITALQQSLTTTALCIGGMTALTENDVTAAEKLIQHVPCAERVKLTTTGTEAVQAALRIARSYTGRPYVLLFEDHYHGWMDNTVGIHKPQEPGNKPKALANDDFFGRAPGAEDGTLMIEWNNIEVLEQTLKNCGDDIACILMEPYTGAGRSPRPGYLERVRELCDQYGIVLCFDEVLTGFRAGLNCAQGVLGITPDLTTVGKAVGGGMPISAVVGKAQVMDVLKQGTTLAGTYMGHFLCVQGLVTTLEILERDNGAAYKSIDRVQEKLMTGLDEIARRRGIPMRIQSVTSMFSTLFGADPDVEQYSRDDGKNIDSAMAFKFWERMQEQGLTTCVDRWMLNIQHTDQDTAIALEAADKAMANL